jgi:hypothetical protein
MQSDHRRSLGFGAYSELMRGEVMGKEGFCGGCAAERVSVLSWENIEEGCRFRVHDYRLRSEFRFRTVIGMGTLRY